MNAKWIKECWCVLQSFEKAERNVQKENKGIGNARVVNNSLKLKGK